MDGVDYTITRNLMQIVMGVACISVENSGIVGYDVVGQCNSRTVQQWDSN